MYAVAANASEVSGPSHTNVSCEELCEEIDKLTLEDINGGNDGDSDVEGEEVEVYDFVSNSEAISMYSVDSNDEGSIKAKLKVMRTGGTVEIGELDINDSIGNSALYNVKIPQPDEGWSPSALKEGRGEPAFDLIDNPRGWQRYIFHPKISKELDKAYIGHYLPTSATPCPIEQNGERVCGDWDFFYNGFKNNAMPFRSSATTNNLFPQEMMGSLDHVIQKLGMNVERVRDVDTLFFFKLLLPFYDPAKSGVDGDPRIPYYTDVEKYTNASTALSGQGSSYGHCWKPTSAGELLRFDANLLHDGVLGSSDGA